MSGKEFGIMLLGGIIGGFCGYMYAKTKIVRDYEAEIADLKDFYEGVEDSEDDFEDEDAENEEYEGDDYDYSAIVEGLNYGKYSTEVTNVPEKMDIPKIYAISDEEFRNSRMENVTTILYWVDDDEFSYVDEEPIKGGIDMIGGADMLKEVGKYEKDVLYVRNERLNTDFEVIITHGTLDMREGDELYDEEDLDE